MSHNKKVSLSGIKPTGKLHIGNYFGAMKQLVDLQDSHQSFVFVADLHALTSVKNGDELRELTMNVVADYIAVGLDPKKTTIFKQSDVPAHTELGWIFNCLTTMPYLMRAHAFKDAEARDKEINVGVFDYPMLMAADILLYSPDVVPVGHDQKQHIEIARDTAEKFNRTFGDVFKLPEAYIVQSVSVIPGTDGRKMSKSYGNTIGLFAEKDEIVKAVMGIPTDSKGVHEPKDPDTDKLFALHKQFADESFITTLRERYTNGQIGYKESKEILIDHIEAFVAPLREKRADIITDRQKLIDVLEAGAIAARKVAEEKMVAVRSKVGLTIH